MFGLYYTLWLVASLAYAAGSNGAHDPSDKMHGGIRMGVKDQTCDTGTMMLERDFPNKTTFAYECQKHEETINLDDMVKPLVTKAKKLHQPLHHCMKEGIKWKEDPPLSGGHRPLWGHFGEYSYLPPQRWLHNMEHGAVVMLYHPCADPREVHKLGNIVRDCLWKHVITPYRHLTTDRPLALITWGWKLTMSRVDTRAAQNFIKEHAMDPSLPEAHYTKQGQFTAGLIRPAHYVTTVEDCVICPSKRVRLFCKRNKNCCSKAARLKRLLAKSEADETKGDSQSYPEQ